MAQLFHTYLYNPILEALVFIYENIAFHDLGIAIIVLTLAVRIVLFPLFYKGAKDQSIMQRLQPEIRKIQQNLKKDKEAQAKALFDLYKTNKINPLSGFLLLLVQLPIIIALYQVFLKGLGNSVFDNKFFLDLIDLGVKSIPLAIVAAILQYFQGRLSLSQGKSVSREENPMNSAAKTMIYIGPILTLSILAYLPGAVGLYWTTSTAISIIQQIHINKKIKGQNGPIFRNNKENSGTSGSQKPAP